jgi:hypothetical protein
MTQRSVGVNRQCGQPAGNHQYFLMMSVIIKFMLSRVIKSVKSTTHRVRYHEL